MYETHQPSNVQPGVLLQPLNQPRCSAVVCAYNEEATLGGVIEGLLASPRIHQIIVVNDGSQDGTAALMEPYANHPRVIPVHLPVNCGKGCALAQGILRASGDLLLFVDSDLLNWDADYADLMIDTLLDRRAGMVIGYPLRKDDRMDGYDRLGLIRALSGERALWRADILPLVNELNCSRFGAEVLMNLHYRRLGLEVQTLPLNGLEHPVKLEKEPLHRALYSYSRECLEILNTLGGHPGMLMQAAGLDGPSLRRRWDPVAFRAQQASLRWGVRRMEDLSSLAGRWKGQWQAQIQNE